MFDSNIFSMSWHNRTNSTEINIHSSNITLTLGSQQWDIFRRFLRVLPTPNKSLNIMVFVLVIINVLVAVVFSVLLLLLLLLLLLFLLLLFPPFNTHTHTPLILCKECVWVEIPTWFFIGNHYCPESKFKIFKNYFCYS